MSRSFRRAVLAALALSLILAACEVRNPGEDAVRLAAAMNGALHEIDTGHGSFRAISTVEDLGGRLHLRTVITGDNREEIGIAVARVFEEARAQAHKAGIPCQTNGSFDRAVMTWDGRRVQCSMLTVGF